MNLTEDPQYDEVSLPFSLKPVSFTKAQAKFIEEALTKVLRRAEDFTARAVNDERLLRSLGITELPNKNPTPIGLHIPFARFDFLFDGENLNILELNTDGTSGYNVMEWLGLKAGVKDSNNPNLNLSLRLLEALRLHKPDASEIGLVDFPEVKTNWEQKNLIELWSKIIPSKMINPANKTWTDDTLFYRRALSWQLRAHRGRAIPFLTDWSENKITVVGGWSSDVGMSKAWPAIERVDHFPETIMASHENCAKIKSEKFAWILKGAMSYGGNAIIRGIDFTQSKWEQALLNVADETENGRSWVAQRLIDIPLVDQKPCEYGMYFLNGKPSGYMCRWGSTDAISDLSSELMRPVEII
jgi:hypothetical protein